QVDGVILVYQAGKVGRLVLRRAKAHLESARATVWGVVLNDVQTEIAGYTYTHYYTHYYGEETPPAPPGRVQRAWDFVRSRLPGAAPSAAAAAPAAAAAAPAEDMVVVVPEDGGADAPSSATPEAERRSYRNLWLGLLMLLGLIGALAAVTGWQMGWMGRDVRPRELLRKRLETNPTAISPDADARRRSVGAVTAPSDPPPAPVATAPATERTVPAPAPAPAVTAAPPAPAPVPPSPSAPPGTTESAGARFAVEFGPFGTAAEAQSVERQLTDAGYQTVSFRQQTGGALYAVLIERVPSARDAQALVSTLREQGFGDAVVLGVGEPLSVRVGDPISLRGAVQLAERLRAKGHQVRVTTQGGQSVTFVIRHGNFATREEAAQKGDEIGRRGLPNTVVRVK
ncbi:MAG: SPOR domain-containing protein, partial [Candidatus Rokubacteria bacterium]|nr:SPOR domain-containing protein [Candidatus Rokubacteria bacterium]